MTPLWSLRIVESRYVPVGEVVILGDTLTAHPVTIRRLGRRVSNPAADARWSTDWYRDPSSAWWEQ